MRCLYAYEYGLNPYPGAIEEPHCPANKRNGVMYVLLASNKHARNPIGIGVFLSVVIVMSDLALCRPTLDSPAGSAAVILHHMPINTELLQTAIVKADEQLAKLRSLMVYRLVSEPLYELDGVVDAAERGMYMMFGLLYAVYVIGIEAPKSFEHCTFETVTCPLGKECQLCHPRSENNLRQWKLRHLPADVRQAIKTLIGGQRTKTSTSNELTRKGNEVRFLERAEKAIVAGHSSKSGFLSRLQSWLAATWTAVVVPNFPLLHFLMRTVPSSDREPSTSPRRIGRDEVRRSPSPSRTRNQSPGVYGREDSPMYSPLSPSQNFARNGSPMYSPTSPIRDYMPAMSPTYCPRTP